ncbi:MAG TPA: amidohydrolase family protein [Iamia sp.]|nr:amidohydrolase family protein [Iamia sp.]
MTPVVDIMNYAPLVAPGLSGPEFQYDEFQIMVTTTFKGMVRDGRLTTMWGREIPADGKVDTDPTLDVPAALAQLDAAGYEATTLCCMKMWSHDRHHKLIVDWPEEVVAEALPQGNGRLIGGAGYDPFHVSESLAKVETAVREWGFEYVYVHPMTFGVAPNDRRMYPLYAKCVELGVPVGFQVGHSAEVLPTEVGRPMLVDDVARDFPTLKINMSHTGWPWTGEFLSMLWRHPNVYGDISAYFASSLDPELVQFMDRQLRHKIMFGSNGLDLTRVREEVEDLPIKDTTKERVLGLNALEFLGRA